MTDEEIEQFFREYIDGFMLRDIRATIEAKANYGAAVLLVNATEVLGALRDGLLGVRGESGGCFGTGLEMMTWGSDPKYYRDFRILLDETGSGKFEEKVPYIVFRCGFAHEYFAKGLATVCNDPAVETWHDDTLAGFGWYDRGGAPALYFCTNAYLRDLAAAFKALQLAVMTSRSLERSNFETSVARIAARRAKPKP